MFWTGHIAAGYLVSVATVSSFNLGSSLTPSQISGLLIFGTIISVAPDLDLILFFKKNKSVKLQAGTSHRTYLSHSPLIWLAAALSVYLLGPSPLIKSAGLLIWSCSWTHFVLDYIDYGIMWFWPFSDKKYHLFTPVDERSVFTGDETPAEYYRKFFFRIYSKTWTFYLEIAIMVFWVLYITRIH